MEEVGIPHTLIKFLEEGPSRELEDRIGGMFKEGPPSVRWLLNEIISRLMVCGKSIRRPCGGYHA